MLHHEILYLVINLNPFFNRLEVARQEMIRRAKILSDRRLDQEKQLTKLEKEQNRARDKAEALSEKYEDVKDRGQELGLRVEHVLSKLQVSKIFCLRSASVE